MKALIFQLILLALFVGDARADSEVPEDSVERMRLLLEHAAGDGEGRRYTAGAGYVTLGAVVGGFGGWLSTREGTSTKASPYILMGYGGVLVGLGGLSMLMTSSEEDLYDAYSSVLRSSSEPARRANAVAAAERRLFALRDRAYARRIWQRSIALSLAGTAALGLVVNEITAATYKDETCFTIANQTSCTSEPSRPNDSIWAGRLAYGSMFALGTTLAVASFSPYPIERIAYVWQNDPARLREQESRPRVAVAPLQGGGHVQLGWAF